MKRRPLNTCALGVASRIVVLTYQHLGDFILPRCSKPRGCFGQWLTHLVGRDGVEPPEPEGNSFTDCPAPTYGISPHISDHQSLFTLVPCYLVVWMGDLFEFLSPLEPLKLNEGVVGRAGIEPAVPRLKVVCLTTRLPAQIQYSRCRGSTIPRIVRQHVASIPTVQVEVLEVPLGVEPRI